MRKLLQLVLFFACAAHAQVDRSAFTFTRYDLQIQVTPADQSLSAKGTITLRNDSSVPQRHAALQISSTLDWKSIAIAGKPAPFLSQPYTSDIDHTGALSEAIVTIPDTRPGATVELQIEYAGTVPRDATRLTRIGAPENRALTADWDTISDSFTAVRGVGYVCWYPVSIEAASLSSGTDVFDAIGAWKRREDAAPMRVAITALTASRGVQIIADDAVVRPQLEQYAGGNQPPFRASREIDYRHLSQTVPTFVIGAFGEVSDAKADTIVEYVPGHESQARDYAAAGAGVAANVAQWFGPATQKVHIVELADPNAVAYDAGAVLFTPLRTIERKALELILAHQLTHATFDSPRPWIYEGLATFAEALEREQQDGRGGAMDFLQSKMPVLAAVEKSHAAAGDAAAPPPSPGANATNAAANSLVNTSDEVLYRNKAMFVWWMLRDMIGDTALQRALARYRVADDEQPAYVQQLLEAESKKQLEWFFDDWVYRDRGLPDCRIDAAFPRPTLADAWGVTVTVENLGGAAAEVPVTVHAKEGERVQRVLVAARAKAVVRVAVPAEPLDAVVNDGSVPESDLGNNSFKIDITRRP